MKTFTSLPVFAAAVIALCVPTFLLAEEPVADAAAETVADTITWQRNLYAGYQQAIAEKKPLVVLFTLPAEEDCEWCERLDQEVIDSNELHALAGRAVFVRAVSTDEDDKDNYAHLKTDLDIKRYPVTVLLDVTDDRIVESGRIVGFFERDAFVGHLNKFLNAWKDGQLPAASK